MDKSTVIAGYSALKIRDFFKWTGGCSFGVRAIGKFFLLPEDAAGRIADELENLGYIEPFGDEPDSYQLTDSGMRLRNWKAIPRIKKEKAMALIDEVVARADFAASSELFPIKIKSIKLFGSCLEDLDDYGDVDIIVQIGNAKPGARIQIGDETKLLRFIKGGSTYINLHHETDLDIIAETKEIFPEGVKERLARMGEKAVNMAVKKGLRHMEGRKPKRREAGDLYVSTYLDKYAKNGNIRIYELFLCLGYDKDGFEKREILSRMEYNLDEGYADEITSFLDNMEKAKHLYGKEDLSTLIRWTLGRKVKNKKHREEWISFLLDG